MLNIRKLNQSIVTVVLAAIVFCASAPHAKDLRTEGLINGYTADMYQGNGIGGPELNEVVVVAKRGNSKQDLENAQGKLKEAQDALKIVQNQADKKKLMKSKLNPLLNNIIQPRIRMSVKDYENK